MISITATIDTDAARPIHGRGHISVGGDEAAARSDSEGLPHDSEDFFSAGHAAAESLDAQG